MWCSSWIDVDEECGVIRGWGSGEWGYMGNGCVHGCRLMGNVGRIEKPQSKTNMDTYEIS